MQDELRYFKKKYWKDLDKKRNVDYFSGTFKPRIKDGKEVKGTKVIRVYVTKKVPLDPNEAKRKGIRPLSKKDILPREVDIKGEKVEIDVVEIGLIKAHCCRDTVRSQVIKKRIRPLVSGISAMNLKAGGACTLGWLAVNKKEGEEEFLGFVGNNHCFGRTNKASKGEIDIQPSPLDGGVSPQDNIATHWRHVELKFNHFTCPYRNFLHRVFTYLVKPEYFINYLDASYEKLMKGIEMLPEFYLIGGVSGKEDFVLNEEVEKVGRTSEHTKGTVVDLDWNGKVQYDRGICYFEDMILIKGRFSMPGDSSSFIRGVQDKKLKGELFGGSDYYTVAFPQSRIENMLEVELVV